MYASEVGGASSRSALTGSKPSTSQPVVQRQSQHGETLNQVGRRYGVSEDQMAAANPDIRHGNTPLADGTTVNIPVGDGKGQARAHTLLPGEHDLSRIAAAYGVTEAQLREANSLGPGQAVYPGTTLLIPAKQGGGGGTTTDPTTVDGLQKQFPSLAGRSSQDVQKMADSVRKLRDGSPAEKVQALAELTQGLKGPDLQRLAKELKLENNPVYKLVTDDASLASLAKLADPKASNTDRADAALSLVKSLGGVMPGKAGDALKPYLDKLPAANAIIQAYNTFSNPKASAADKITAGLTLAGSLGKLAPQKLQDALKPVLSFLPAGNALVGAIAKWADPNASALDRAKAALSLAQAVRDSAGDAFPSIAHNLRSLDSSLDSIGAALTLLDPNATLQDKAQAALTLAADVPQLAGDLSALKQFLVGHGVSGTVAQHVAEQIERMPAVQRLPESVRKGLDANTARNLTNAQADQIAKSYAESAESIRQQALKGIDPADANKLAAAADGARTSADDFGKSITKALSQIKDKDALSAFVKSLDSSTDHAARKALVDTVSALKPGVADKVLTGTIDGKPATEVLRGALAKLKDDPDALKKFTGLIAEGDEKTVKLALQLGDSVDGTVLKDTLRAIGDSKLAGKALGVLGTLLDKAGVRITGEIAEKVLKGVAKIVPIAGAIPAALDAAQMAQIAANTHLPADIRFAALQAAKLNGTDAALSVVEPFIAEFGVPVAADVALAAGEVGLDIIVSDQEAKFEANPSGYRAPDWLQVANLGMATAEGPEGIAELALIYGPKGALNLVGAATRIGGAVAMQAVTKEQQLEAQGVGKGLHYTAEGLHRLADMIRNPKKYGAAAVALGEAAVKRLSDLARGGGELAKLAGKELGNLVGDLKNLGAQGVRALGWIASHPGEAATKAINALSDLASQGLELAGDAGNALAHSALTALAGAKDALGKAGGAAKAAYDAAQQAVTNTVHSAIALGRQGIETLGWIARHPGAAAQIARQALVDTAAKAGELAKEAYDHLVGLGADGVQLVKEVAGKLKDAGEAGVEMLEYVVNNPGQAAADVRKAALDSLKSIAQGAGSAATAATHAVVGFVDTGVQEAKATATELLKDGGAAAKAIAEAWSKNLSEGGKEVISGLKDLGSAGLGALNDLKNAGISFAGDVLGSIGHGIGGLWHDATSWIP